MTRITTKELMEKLEEIDIRIQLEKFLSFGYFMFSVGIAIVSIGFFISNNSVMITGILSFFIGIISGLIYYYLKTKKELEKK